MKNFSLKNEKKGRSKDLWGNKCQQETMTMAILTKHEQHQHEGIKNVSHFMSS